MRVHWMWWLLGGFTMGAGFTFISMGRFIYYLQQPGMALFIFGVDIIVVPWAVGMYKARRRRAHKVRVKLS